MAHAQQQILAALQSLLAAGGTAASTRVYLDRLDPLDAADLPALLIEEAPDGETSEPFTISSIDQRELLVQVSCVVSHSSTYASDARALGLAVEKLIAPSSSLRALCSLGQRITASRLQLEGDGDRALAARVQTWRFSYAVAPAAPDVLL